VIQRRLSKLESAFLPPADSWETQRLRERMEAGQKRVAALYGEGYLPRAESVPNLTVVERLQAGRPRARQRHFSRGRNELSSKERTVACDRIISKALAASSTSKQTPTALPSDMPYSTALAL